MVYKIRVILDAKETIFRDIEIKDKQTLWNLHLGIKSAFSLPGEELSSFYFSDDEWNEGRAVPLEDMSDDGDGEIMSDIYHQVKSTAIEYEDPNNLSLGANIAGFKKVASAMLAQGIY